MSNVQTLKLFDTGMSFLWRMSKGKVNPESIIYESQVSKPIDTYVHQIDSMLEYFTKNLDSFVNKNNFLNSGSEADVYKLCENYVLRINGKVYNGKQKFHAIKDVFEGKNFGQAVAVSEDGTMTINKRLKGNVLYRINELDGQKYMANLREYANLSDDTLENFVSDVAYINSKGYRIDQGVAENFLYDRKTGRIGIIDITPKESETGRLLGLFEPYGHDWILEPLVNGHDLLGVYRKLSPNERKEMFELISNLETRIIPLCKKYNIPISKWKENKYTESSLMSILQTRHNIDYTKGLGKQTLMTIYPNEADEYCRLPDYY